MEDVMTVNEAQIHHSIEERVIATRNKDINAAALHYANDVLIFDVVGPLQHKGLDAMKQRLAEWFATFQGTIGFELKDIIIIADNNVAFSRSLNHVSGALKNGGTLNMWWRETLGWQKLDGQWLVINAHDSVPFDVSTGKGSTDLKP